MPGMVAFGRRWLCETDDMIFIGVIDSIAYFPWIIWSGLKIYKWLFFDGGGNFCRDSSLFQDAVLPVASFCCVMTVQWLLAIGFVYFSTRGTMRQVQARLPCVTLFHVKTVVNVLGAMWVVFVGSLFHKDDFCNIDVKVALMAAMAFQSLASMVQLTLWWVFFDSDGSLIGSKTKKKTTRQANFFLCSTPRNAVDRWRFRLLTLLFWSLSPSKEKKNAISSVAEILAYIPRELGIVLTDFAAGVMLMREKHKRYLKKEQLKLDSLAAITLPDGSPVDRFPTTDMPVWMNLLLAKQCFQYFRGKESLVQGDGNCRSNVAGVQLNSSILYKDLIRVSFRNKLYVIPFSVAVDVDTSAVVITVRGTRSTKDVLTDVASEISSTMDLGRLQDTSCHGGILKAARRIGDILKDKGVLEAALESRDHYHLITTGHNLGASVAAILALLLRPSYPSVKCFAFEPLPCLSSKALETTFDCVFSVVFGNNVVPYLSFRSVAHMVQETVKCAAECNLPKYKVFFWPLPGGDEDLTLRKDKAECGTAENEKPEESGRAEAESDPKKEEKGRASRQDSEDDEEAEKPEENKKAVSKQSNGTDLYIPGRVLRIRSSKNGYRLQIGTAKDFHLPMILPDMVMHHPPQYIAECLEHLGSTSTLLSVNL